ncbi:suppressor of tub2 mutation [Serendipita sp. 399]|nr:suppressor of tub2 mutation [Serendipita sp. 399]
MAESDERISRCLERLKSNDSEVKVDAINKLQAEFAAGPTEVEEVITALKTTLRIPNQHISTASLSAIAALFPVLIHETEEGIVNPHDAAVLRHALSAFLSAGGVVDRLGDNREKARECAREALVSAGNTVFKSNPNAASTSTKTTHPPKGPEPPLAMFERFLRDLGFSSKGTRVREQAILTLVQLRRSNPRFPIRPFLTHLVDTLEDSDGGVRDCARASVIEIFTAAGVTDGARADLKKEMAKKGVRKGILDSILGQLMNTGGQGTETPLAEAQPPAESVPSATATSRPRLGTLAASYGPSRTMSVASAVNESSEGSVAAEVVPVASARDLEQEFAAMNPPFDGRETEHNWGPRERAIQRVRGMLRGDVHIRFPDIFIEELRSGFMANSLKTLTSLRTTLALNTCLLYTELVQSLENAYEPFVELTLTPLFRMSSLTKKIVATQSQSTAKDILIHGHCHPRLVIPMLWSGVQDKNPATRQYSLSHIRTILENTALRSKSVIESTGGLELLEKSIKKALGDPNAGIRDAARVIFWIFDGIWKDRAEILANTLDSVARKQLEKAAPKDQVPQASTSTSTEPKKASIAAAIAASRAKAKQIAAAPPTLRHAATSHASSIASQSRRPASPVTHPTGRTASVSVLSSSTKRSSGTFTRSATSPALNNTIKSPSRSTAKSNESSSPPSSPTQQAAQRRISVRVASAVPLPSSPTSNTLSPPRTHSPLRSPLSSRSASPPISNPPPNLRRASGVFSSPKGGTLSPGALANDALTTSDDDSLMRVRAPASEADSDESVPVASFSDAAASTPPSKVVVISGLTRSTNPLKMPGPVVEDALRARAEQAESAAERLLEELAEPDHTPANSHLPAELVPSVSTLSIQRTNIQRTNGDSTPRPPPSDSAKQLGKSKANVLPPVTPNHNRSVLLRQAAAYQDSPPYKGGSHSIVEKLKDNRNESSWWLKRITLLEQNRTSEDVPSVDLLRQCTNSLSHGTAEVSQLKQVILICSQTPVVGDEEPLANSDTNSQSAEFWGQGSRFKELIEALFHYLSPEKSEDVLEYGLIALWEMIENQATYLEGRESEILSLLFHLRYANMQTVAEASSTIRDAIATRIDPVYGLTTTHSSLKRFLAEPVPAGGSPEARALSHAFGLLAIGKFILRLPSEILEEELPRLQLTLSKSLNDPQLLVREAAASAIIAAQLVLRDETYLFTMLASLSDEKKNLLTYLFDKHGARGPVEGVTGATTQMGGLDKLEKEMKRLDSRTSTPLRKP